MKLPYPQFFPTHIRPNLRTPDCPSRGYVHDGTVPAPPPLFSPGFSESCCFSSPGFHMLVLLLEERFPIYVLPRSLLINLLYCWPPGHGILRFSASPETCINKVPDSDAPDPHPPGATSPFFFFLPFFSYTPPERWRYRDVAHSLGSGHDAAPLATLSYVCPGAPPSRPFSLPCDQLGVLDPLSPLSAFHSI